jgi:hypothetical protein
MIYSVDTEREFLNNSRKKGFSSILLRRYPEARSKKHTLSQPRILQAKWCKRELRMCRNLTCFIASHTECVFPLSLSFSRSFIKILTVMNHYVPFCVFCVYRILQFSSFIITDVSVDSSVSIVTD